MSRFVIFPVSILILLSASCNSGLPLSSATENVTIEYELPSSGTVDILVSNNLMQNVRTLLEGQEQQAGTHSVVWDLTDDDGERVEDGLYTVEVYLDGERVHVEVLEVYEE